VTGSCSSHSTCSTGTAKPPVNAAAAALADTALQLSCQADDARMTVNAADCHGNVISMVVWPGGTDAYVTRFPSPAPRSTAASCGSPQREN